MSHDIFISHASKDKALADRFVDVILSNGCNLSSERILCTSLEGMSIPSGTSNFIDFLKGQVKDSKLVILLLTENYFDSVFCICELGATWGLDLKLFPITISPITKNDMPGTLKVSQAGDIFDKSHLDELRDEITKLFESDVKTSRWNVKRDTFIKSVPDLIADLPKPENIKKSELEQITADYTEALDENGELEKHIKSLKDQIKELEAVRPLDQVKRIRRAKTGELEEFQQLCKESKQSINRLQWASIRCLFWQMREKPWDPERDDWDSVKLAEAKEEVFDDPDLNGCSLNTNHPKVMKAIDSLNELENFMSNYTDLEDSTFIDDLKEEHEFPISLTNRDFWSAFLVSV